jgi:enoyl-[acyl-carrier protein] reductase I
MQDLKGKKGLIVGIANDDSIAWGCAQSFHEGGAELAVTYQNEKAKPYVLPLAEKINASIFMPLDVLDDAQMTSLFVEIEKKWGKLDFILHAVAYSPKQDLQGRVVDSTRDGFLLAMDISCHSFIRLAHLAEPLMKDGGTLLTLSYYGGEKVVTNYGIMGPVKAALESAVKYLASELGRKGIRVNALSPGPILTRAAGGIAHFDELMEHARVKSPGHTLTCVDCVGSYARFLVSDEAKLITGSTLYIDAGFNIMAP